MRELRSQDDSFLEGMTDREVRAIVAGYFLHAEQVAKELGDERAQKSARSQFNQLLTQ
jgi:hypothetical protein